MGLVQKVTSNGILYSFGIVFNRVVPAWLFRCRRYVVLEMKAGNNLEIRSDKNDGPVIKWCESEPDFRSTERLTFFSRNKQAFEAKACMARHNDQTVGGFWYAIENFVEDELGVRYRLRPGQAWLFAAYVDKEFRNLGIHHRMLKFVVSGVNQLGFPQVFLAVNPDNKPSMHVHQKYANQNLGRIFAIRFLNVTACFVSGSPISSNRRLTWNCKKSPIVIEFAV